MTDGFLATAGPPRGWPLLPARCCAHADEAIAVGEEGGVDQIALVTCLHRGLLVTDPPRQFSFRTIQRWSNSGAVQAR